MLLRRLAVFVGGWTAESAEAVASDIASAPLPATEVVPLLLQLVSKSLVVVVEERDGETRYRYLETIREYARELLVESTSTMRKPVITSKRPLPSAVTTKRAPEVK